MKRENKTKYAILGLISWKPMSGYDVKKAIERSLGYFWAESYGQIYPVLKTLEKEGLAVKSIEKSEGKPDRKVYSITDEGKKALKEWLLKPPDPYKARMEILLKLCFGREIPVEESLKHIEKFREEQKDLLEEYSEIEENLNNFCRADADNIYWLLTLKCGLHVSNALVSWCDEAEELLKENNKRKDR